MKNQFKRRIILINKKFQLHLIGTFLAGVLLSVVLFSIGFLSFFWIRDNFGDMVFDEYMIRYYTVEKEVVVELEDGTEVMETARFPEQELIKRWDIIAPVIFWNNLIVIIILSLVGLSLSHRLAGPIYRINKTIDEVLEDRIERPIKLRKGDFFHETAHKLNTLFKKLDIV